MPAVENDRKGPLQVHRGLSWAIGCLINSNGGHCSLPSSECLLARHPPAQCGPAGSITEAGGQGCPYCGVSKDYTASGCQRYLSLNNKRHPHPHPPPPTSTVCVCLITKPHPGPSSPRFQGCWQPALLVNKGDYKHAGPWFIFSHSGSCS